MRRIFISYAHEDQTFALHLKQQLEESEFYVWLDKSSIKGGEDWMREIARGINAAEAIVVCLTPDAITSEYVRREIFLACVNQKKIVPVMVQECYNLLPQYTDTKHLLDLHIIDFYNKDEAIAFSQLVNSLRRETTRPILEQVFDHSDGADFSQAISTLGISARRIIMIGAGLNLLQRDPLVMSILDRASQGECDLEVFLAEPSSPTVETRLIEEETGTVVPPIGRDGIVRRINNLLRTWNNLGRPKTIRIRLFSHYPTFALLIMDNDYFVYPYAYAQLGNFSPVFHFVKGNPAAQPVIDFLDAHYDRVKAASLDAQTVQDTRDGRNVDTHKLLTLALYFIPAEDTALYRFGTRVLGYDVRQRTLTDSPWADRVGGARRYGMHMTIVDALYFLAAHEIRQVVAEIEYVAEKLAPFELTRLHIQPRFPGPNTVSLAVTDLSGTLEVLHYEAIQRVYRRACASNYSLGLAPIDRSPEKMIRAALMVQRYRAPYVMSEYVPHFTLLKKVPPEDEEVIVRELQQEFEAQGVGSTISVDRLAVMSYSDPQESWVIETEIPLKMRT